MSNDTKYYDLPSGWAWATISDITFKVTDGSHNPPSRQNNGIPMLSAKNITDNDVDFNKDIRYISEESYKYENERTNIESGDVLLTIVGSIGRVAIVPEYLNKRFAIQRSVALIKPCVISGKYVMYAFQAPFFQKILQNEAKGTAQKGVYLGTLKALQIPVPPLNEQHLIVEKLEEVFSELEQSKIGLLEASAQLKTYRQAFLKNVLENNGIVERNNVTILKKFKGLRKVFLGDIVNKISKKVNPLDHPELKFVGLDSIESNSLKINSIYMFKDYSSSGNYFEKENILYARMRPYLNKVFRAEFDGAASGEFIVLECKEDILNNYLKYILHSAAFVNYANERSTGDRPRVSFEDLSLFEFYLCDLDEQQQIVNEIDNRFTIIENLDDTIQSNLQSIDLYRQSILKKAFKGELTTQDNENESATNLLERIQSEILNYRKEQRVNVQNNPRMKKTKKTLISVIRENFPESEFSFTELKDHLQMSYQEVKEQLFILLDEDKEITSRFNKKQEQVTFKLKS